MVVVIYTVGDGGVSYEVYIIYCCRGGHRCGDVVGRRHREMCVRGSLCLGVLLRKPPAGPFVVVISAGGLLLRKPPRGP